MPFDWEKFLASHGIDYIEKGPNLRKGNIGISCPFCADDPSYHMGISLEGRGWHCWRKPDHRGKNPIRLVQALLGCSWEQARRIVGQDRPLIQDFALQMEAMIQEEEEEDDRPGLDIPPEFRAFTQTEPASLCRPFFDYLKKRGFGDRAINRLSSRYGVYYSLRGSFKGRIIFLVRNEGRLMSWTGRTIYRQAEPRYLALTTDEDDAKKAGLQPALAPLTNFLLWEDALRNTEGEAICICEGPFDALKVAIHGRGHSIFSTCLFTSSASERQIETLFEILPNFKRRYILLDAGTLPIAQAIADRLSGLGVQTIEVPPGVKDPGDLTKEQLLELDL